MYLILVRHGETDFNKLERMQGSEVDPPLNDIGIKQAIETGKFLNNMFKFSKIYSSPYLRTIKTSEIIKKEIKFKDEIEIEDNLIESTKGVFSGKTKDEVKDIINSTPELKKIEKDNKKYNHLEKLIHIYDYSKVAHITKQEDWFKIGERASKILNKIINENFGKNILIVTHGSFIGNAIRNIFKIRQFHCETVGKGNCSITVIKIDKDKSKELIMSVNNMHLAHLY
tara:strand:+ start:5586 stop:6266 length:681 start_codon:yes stop_codon:yes gene_type:complete